MKLRRFFGLMLGGLLTLGASDGFATIWTVAGSGGDFTSIQAALDVAVAGDTIQVRDKGSPYFEKVSFPRSGNAINGFISLEAFPGEEPILDGTGVSGANMVLIEDRSWVRMAGFEIRNNLGVNDGSGVRVVGAGSHVEIRDNDIHDIRGDHAMGITVYGTRSASISDLVIDGNEIHDCEPAQSEALTLNGNVENFAVINNLVRDVNSIGIDFIGGETDIQPDPSKVARNGVCRGNTVIRARADYEGGFAGAIYVDGGRDIVIENNVVTESDLGIEIGAENAGLVTSGVIVRSNVVHRNDKAGIVFGGFSSSVGTVEDCEFRNNTLYQNDTLGQGFGEIWVQYAEGNVVRNNVVFATDQNLVVASYDNGNVDNVFDHNLWFTEGGAAAARFIWNDDEHVGFSTYRSETGQDASSIFDDPELASPATGDFHLAAQSPAINAGDPATVASPGETDLDGAPRVSGPRIDIGADEITCGDGTTNPGEQCDDSNQTDGDGCDSNCTLTGCGNGVVTAGEACDDGNQSAGDCCGATCQLEANGSACDDGRACTRVDTCSSGACAGLEEPEPACRTAGTSAISVRATPFGLKDRLGWTWKKGDATSFAALGNPVTGETDYALCLYDRDAGAHELVLEAEIAPGGTCAGKPCWSASGDKGYSYKDKTAARAGIAKLILRAGVQGKASITLKAQGTALQTPALPLQYDPGVTLQLHNDEGECWSASFAAPAKKNDDGTLKDKSP